MREKEQKIKQASNVAFTLMLMKGRELWLLLLRGSRRAQVSPAAADAAAAAARHHQVEKVGFSQTRKETTTDVGEGSTDSDMHGWGALKVDDIQN